MPIKMCNKNDIALDKMLYYYNTFKHDDLFDGVDNTLLHVYI